MLPLNLSVTAATSQDGSSLEFITVIAGRQCYVQDTSGTGLCIFNRFGATAPYRYFNAQSVNQPMNHEGDCRAAPGFARVC